VSIIVLVAAMAQEGWVYKKRTETRPRIHQRRYMRLDEGSHDVQYYKQPSEVKTKGTIDLLDARRMWPTDVADLGTDKHAKEVGSSDRALSLQTSKRTFFLIFESRADFEAWLLAIWKACDQSQCTLHKSLLNVPGIRTASVPKGGAAAPLAEPEFRPARPPSLAPAPARPVREQYARDDRDEDPSPSPAMPSSSPFREQLKQKEQRVEELAVNLEDDEEDDRILSGGQAGAGSGGRGLFGGLFGARAPAVAESEEGSSRGGRGGRGRGSGSFELHGIRGGARGAPARGRGGGGRGRGGRGGPPGRGRGGPPGRGRGGPLRGGRGGRPLGALLLDEDSEEESDDSEEESDDDGDSGDGDNSSEEGGGSQKRGKAGDNPGCCVIA